MTLKEARRYIKQCEKHPLRIERTELISQGPGEGWCVSVALMAERSAAADRKKAITAMYRKVGIGR